MEGTGQLYGDADTAFARWLRERIGGRTLGQFAIKAEVSTSTLSRWLHNQSRPTPENILRLEEITDTPARQIAALLPDQLNRTAREMPTSTPTGPLPESQLREIAREAAREAIAEYAEIRADDPRVAVSFSELEDELQDDPETQAVVAAALRRVVERKRLRDSGPSR